LAWHELATIERLFPALPGTDEYRQNLRRITKESNEFLLRIVEDLSYEFSDGRENIWTPDVVEENRDRFLNELLAERDGFIYRNEAIILSTLEEDGSVEIVEEAAAVAR
jgi:hypothetical protein